MLREQRRENVKGQQVSANEFQQHRLGNPDREKP